MQPDKPDFRKCLRNHQENILHIANDLRKFRTWETNYPWNGNPAERRAR
ncbi:MAG: hypothetical protein C75L2_00370017 [Leptospirillum sp. Group II 'C75']|jgi:hypothetical protein|nr:MAG: hypothetical protein C75L2_00370017 [Leptospirillum sp. Group II 'C75']